MTKRSRLSLDLLLRPALASPPHPHTPHQRAADLNLCTLFPDELSHTSSNCCCGQARGRVESSVWWGVGGSTEPLLS